ncbi:MAG: methyltransferase family protein [Promethearchaeota archaeon]
METKQISHSRREYPHGHLIQITIPIIFSIIWILDMFVLQWTIWLNSIVPLPLRIILSIATFVLAFFTIYSSHKLLFDHNRPSDSLINDGILKYVRNPLYLGVLFIYVAFIFLSMSLISIISFVIVFLVYNKLVNYEERILEDLFGEKYKKYKSSTSKWIPNPFK